MAIVKRAFVIAFLGLNSEFTGRPKLMFQAYVIDRNVGTRKRMSATKLSNRDKNLSHNFTSIRVIFKYTHLRCLSSNLNTTSCEVVQTICLAPLAVRTDACQDVYNIMSVWQSRHCLCVSRLSARSSTWFV